MSWLWLKAVPWGTVLATAPALVDSARKLLERRAQTAQQLASDPAASEPAALVRRVQLLEARQQQIAELLESLATSNEQLSTAVQYLRARGNFRIAIMLAIAVAALAARLLSG